MSHTTAADAADPDLPESITLYLREIAAVPRISPDQEVMLARRIATGDTAGMREGPRSSTPAATP